MDVVPDPSRVVPPQSPISLYSVTGESLVVLGTVTLDLCILGHTYPVSFRVLSGLSVPLILGRDFLAANNILLRVAKSPRSSVMQCHGLDCILCSKNVSSMSGLSGMSGMSGMSTVCKYVPHNNSIIGGMSPSPEPVCGGVPHVASPSPCTVATQTPQGRRSWKHEMASITPSPHGNLVAPHLTGSQQVSSSDVNGCVGVVHPSPLPPGDAIVGVAPSPLGGPALLVSPSGADVGDRCVVADVRPGVSCWEYDVMQTGSVTRQVVAPLLDQPVQQADYHHILQLAHGSIHRAPKSMEMWVRKRGIRWPRLLHDARLFKQLCTPCQRAEHALHSHIPPHVAQWDLSSPTAQWGMDSLVIGGQEGLQVLNGRCRGSTHWWAVVLPTTATAADIWSQCCLMLLDEPFYDPKTVLGDADHLYTPELIQKFQSVGVQLLPGTPNRHGNSSSEGTNLWLRRLLVKWTLEYGTFAALKPFLSAKLNAAMLEHSDTPQSCLGGYTPDEFVLRPLEFQMANVHRRYQSLLQQCNKREQTGRHVTLPQQGSFWYWPVAAERHHPDLHRYTGPYHFTDCAIHPGCRINSHTRRHVSVHRLKLAAIYSTPVKGVTEIRPAMVSLVGDVTGVTYGDVEVPPDVADCTQASHSLESSPGSRASVPERVLPTDEPASPVMVEPLPVESVDLKASLAARIEELEWRREWVEKISTRATAAVQALEDVAEQSPPLLHLVELPHQGDESDIVQGWDSGRLLLSVSDVEPPTSTLGDVDLCSVSKDGLPPPEELVHLDPEMQAILRKRPRVFEVDPSAFIKVPPVHLEWTGVVPAGAFSAEYNHTPLEKRFLDEEFAKWKEAGLMHRWFGPSSFAAAVFPVDLDDDSARRPRAVFNYRPGLNKALIPVTFPQPTISGLLSKMGKKRWFSAFDLKGGYHQLRIDQASSELCMVRHGVALWRPSRLMEGVFTAPGIFTSIMHDINKEQLDEGEIAIYLDDVCAASEEKQQHLREVDRFLEQCQIYDVRLSFPKCQLMRQELQWLGHSIRDGQVRPLSSYLAKLKALPLPETVEDLQRGLGLMVWIVRHLPGAIRLASPLYNMLEGKLTPRKRKDKLLWTPGLRGVWSRLKTLMLSPAVLALPDPGLPYHIQVDASALGYGACLMQMRLGYLVPVEFLSQRWKTKWQLHAPARTLELSALSCAVKHWSYLILNGLPVSVQSDHRSLSQLIQAQPDDEPRVRLAIGRLAPMNLQIDYVPGKFLIGPDWLSREGIKYND
jgi:hypothetical protein